MSEFRLISSKGQRGHQIRSEAGIGVFDGRPEFLEARSRHKVSSGIDFDVRQLTRSAIEFGIRIPNRGPGRMRLKEICVFEGAIREEGNGWQAGHCEMFKRERYLDGFGAYTGGFFRPLDSCEGDFGLSEDLPFPGLFFTHPERGTLLLAVLTQERCKPLWQIRKSGRSIRIRILDWFSGIPAIPVPEGGHYEGERHVAIFSNGGVDEAMDQYYTLLRKRIKFPGASSVLREAVVWGSWNYNPRPRGFWDVTHDFVKSNARELRRMFPDRPRYVMIDDGYQRGRSAETAVLPQPGADWMLTGGHSPPAGTGGNSWFNSAFESFYPHDAPSHDKKLFPAGMRAAARDILKMGCEPAIWVTPRLHRISELAQAHPQWLLRLDGQEHFGPRSAYLDYSIPEVREFTKGVWERITGEWGYKGIKLDFWTLPFEIPQVRYHNHDLTAIQLRNRFLEDLRQYIPADGYILTAVATSYGNPFPGRFIDSARHSDDIGAGTWEELCESARILGVSSTMFRHDCLLADSDSFGWRSNSPPGHNRLGATMALLSGAVCEIGGDLPSCSKEARDFILRGVNFFGPAKKTRVFREGAGWGGMPGQIVLEREDGVFQGILNWTRYPREIVFRDKVRDVWSGTIHKGKVFVPPQDAILFRSNTKC